MPVKPFTPVVLVALLAALLSPAVGGAAVLVFCLDTSGSMNKHGKFEAAKVALIQQIKEAPPGDVVYVIAFDSNDYPLGRLEVGEDGSPEAKTQLMAKIQGLKARGRYTNLDQPLKSAKALLLEERAPGARKIVILSDGISDPSPDHSKIDLTGIAQMIPQTLGWAVYLVGLPDDIAGLFQAPPQDTGFVLAPEEPHIKGIALQRFSREKLEAAVTVAKRDVPAPAPLPLPAPAVQEPLPLPLPVQDASALPETTPESTGKAEAPRARPAFPLLWVLGAGLCAVMGVWPLWRRRRPRNKTLTSFTLDVQEGTGATQRFPVAFGDKEKKTVGPRGDIPLTGDPQLPAIVCTLCWSKGRLWLTPQDTIAVHGQPITTRTAVGAGARISVRDHVHITIEPGEENA